MARLRYRVAARRRHTAGATTLSLLPDDPPGVSSGSTGGLPSGPSCGHLRETLGGASGGRALSASWPGGRAARIALPGQYWMLYAAGGVRVAAVAAGDQAIGGEPLEVTTLRVPCGRPFGEVGDRVGVRGPFGLGWDLETTIGRTLLAVGWEAGLAVLRPAIDQALARPARHSQVRVWAGGGPAVPFAEEWARWSGLGAGVTIAAGARDMTAAAEEPDLDPAATVALLAGPLPMMHATAAALVRRGVPERRIQLATHHLIRCANGGCGRCRLHGRHGPLLACHNGPVLGYEELAAGPA
jgi:anaerobic sulfite reductase subunit B